jgi:hypothetical protein
MKKRREGRTVKKRLVLVVGAFAIAGAIVAVCINQRKPGGITLDSYDKIEMGMTLKQVEDILGGPPRLSPACHGAIRIREEALPEKWSGPQVAIYITFDAQERVCDKKMETHDFGPAPTFLDKVRSRLPW